MIAATIAVVLTSGLIAGIVYGVTSGGGAKAGKGHSAVKVEPTSTRTAKLIVYLAPGATLADIERTLPPGVRTVREHTSANTPLEVLSLEVDADDADTIDSDFAVAVAEVLLESGVVLLAETDFELDAEDLLPLLAEDETGGGGPNTESQWSVGSWLNQALQDFNDALGWTEEGTSERERNAGTGSLDPNPNWSRQWGMQTVGLLPDTTYSGAPGAWATTTGDRAVKVCIIDSGIDFTHPDLVGNIWVNPGEIPGDGIDNDENGWVDDVHGYNFDEFNSDVSDSTGHGTHIAGVLGAISDNYGGTSGVNKQVSIITCKMLGESGRGYYTNVIKCIDYCIANGARITSMSLGFTSKGMGTLEAIRMVRSENNLIVFSAGNDGVGPVQRWTPTSASLGPHVWPASYSTESMLSVGGLSRDGELWTVEGQGKGSNWGPAVDIGAPGENIFSTFKGGRYTYMSGTSMSVPFVAGSAALLLAADPTLKSNELKRLLMDGAVSLPGLVGKISSGRVNAAVSMQLLNQLAGQQSAMFIGEMPEEDVLEPLMVENEIIGNPDTSPPAPASPPPVAESPDQIAWFLRPPSVQIVSTSQPFPLQWTSIEFHPNEGIDARYTSCVRRNVYSFPVDPASATTINIFAEDVAYSYRVISLGQKRFPFYDHAYDEVVLSARGFVGFSIATVLEEALGSFRQADLSTQLAAPRVSLLFTDELAPGWGGGNVSYQFTSDSLVITWNRVRGEPDGQDTNSMQLQLFFDGVVRMTYLEVTASQSYRAIGVSEGSGIAASSAFVVGSFQTAAPTCPLQ